MFSTVLRVSCMGRRLSTHAYADERRVHTARWRKLLEGSGDQPGRAIWDIFLILANPLAFSSKTSIIKRASSTHISRCLCVSRGRCFWLARSRDKKMLLIGLRSRSRSFRFLPAGVSLPSRLSRVRVPSPLFPSTPLSSGFVRSARIKSLIRQCFF